MFSRIRDSGVRDDNEKIRVDGTPKTFNVVILVPVILLTLPSDVEADGEAGPARWLRGGEHLVEGSGQCDHTVVKSLVGGLDLGDIQPSVL